MLNVKNDKIHDVWEMWLEKGITYIEGLLINYILSGSQGAHPDQLTEKIYLWVVKKPNKFILEGWKVSTDSVHCKNEMHHSFILLVMSYLNIYCLNSSH